MPFPLPFPGEWVWRAEEAAGFQLESDAGGRWSTHSREAFAIFFGGVGFDAAGVVGARIGGRSGGCAAVLASYRGTEGLRGDLGRGEEVYRKNCAACHALHGVGFALGPDLAGHRGRPVGDFLVAILDPNAAIEPRFVAFNVEVIDGRSLTGVIAVETGTTVTLALAGGVSEVIPRTNIRSLKTSAVSHMPEGFESIITPHAMADLLTWISQ